MLFLSEIGEIREELPGLCWRTQTNPHWVCREHRCKTRTLTSNPGEAGPFRVEVGDAGDPALVPKVRRQFPREAGHLGKTETRAAG